MCMHFHFLSVQLYPHDWNRVDNETLNEKEIEVLSSKVQTVSTPGKPVGFAEF